MTAGFGAFGKMPSMGDFLRLNLGAGFVQSWDQWLQSGMLDAKGLTGDRWMELYMSTPIWRFTVPAGQAGKAAMSGILMASVDRVGRQYPLTLAAPQNGVDTALMHFANTPMFEMLETIALRALEDETDRDTLMQTLSGVPIPAPVAGAVAGNMYAGPLPAEAALAARAISQKRGNPGIWSTALDGDNRLMLCSNLPAGPEMAALFDLDAAFWRGASAEQMA